MELSPSNSLLYYPVHRHAAAMESPSVDMLTSSLRSSTCDQNQLTLCQLCLFTGTPRQMKSPSADMLTGSHTPLGHAAGSVDFSQVGNHTQEANVCVRLVAW